jgi:hypothetical protein
LKVKFGSIVTEGRGALGDDVYSRNRYGAYARPKNYEYHAPSSYQTFIRTCYGAAAANWKALTEEQRIAWYAYASTQTFKDVFADTHSLAAPSLYASLNFWRAYLSLSLLTFPPTKPQVSLLSSIDSLSILDDGTVLVTYSPALTDSSFNLLFFSTPGMNVGRYSDHGHTRIIDTRQGPLDATLDLSSEYVARFGLPELGKKIFLHISVLSRDSGYLSTPLRTSTIVEAS